MEEKKSIIHRKFRMTKTMDPETIYTKLEALQDSLHCLLTCESDHVPVVSDTSLLGLQNLLSETMGELELALFGEPYGDINVNIEDLEEVAEKAIE